MKNSLLTFCAALFLAGSTGAQTIVNGAMESWQTVQTDEPNGWYTSNNDGNNTTGLVTASKTSDSHSGSAIKIETKLEGTDLKPGYFSNSNGDPLAGDGGVPYSQQPTHITGYYKSGIVAGDSGIVLVIFKKSGAIVSQDVFHIIGTHSTFTQFSFALTLSVVPDSVIIAAASSNAITEIGAAAGSYMIIDDLAFTGTGITQAIPEGTFDNWTTITSDYINDWGSYGEVIAKSTESYKGTYAITLGTFDAGQGNVYGSGISNAQSGNNGPVGGTPFTRSVDTLLFWYKYVPQGGDSAVAFVSLTKNSTPVGGGFIRLGGALNYTKVEIPFSCMSAPDSIRIDISSSLNGSGGNWHPPVVGSMLWVDEVQLKSEPLNTGLQNIFGSAKALSVYPNPFADQLEINMEGNTAELSYSINDITGKILITGKGNSISTASLNKGVYFVSVSDEAHVLGVKKIVKE